MTGALAEGFTPSGRLTTILLLSPIYISQLGITTFSFVVTRTTNVNFSSFSSLPMVPLSSPVEDWLLGTLS